MQNGNVPARCGEEHDDKDFYQIVAKADLDRKPRRELAEHPQKLA